MSLNWIKHHLQFKDIKIGDWLILFLMLGLEIFLIHRYWLSNTFAVDFVALQVGNQPLKLYSALDSRQIEIKTDSGSSMIEIAPGKVRFLHSQCLSQQCVAHGWITSVGETITCLPNQITVSLIGSGPQYDAMNF